MPSPPLRPRALLALAALTGCSRNCAGPFSEHTVARADGARWEASLVCVPVTEVGGSRGDLFTPKGCTARVELRVKGRAGDTTRATPGVLQDRDCSAVRARCRALRGEVRARRTPTGDVIGATVEGHTWALLAHVTPEGVAFLYERWVRAGPLDDALRRAPDPDAALTTMLRESPARRGDRAIGDALQGETLRRLRGELLDAMARCAAPEDGLRHLARDDSGSFDAMYTSGWFGPRCEASRRALERELPERVSGRVPRDLARLRGAPPEALTPLVLTAGALSVREAEGELSALAHADAAESGAAQALWRGALWAWWRVDPSAAGSAAAQWLRTNTTRSYLPPRLPPFTVTPPSWHPRPLVLAACAAAGGASTRAQLYALARDRQVDAYNRRLAVLAVAAQREGDGRALDEETGLGALPSRRQGLESPPEARSERDASP